MKIRFCLLIIGLFFSGCSFDKLHLLKEFQETRFLMGTYVKIHCFYENRVNIDDIIEKCWNRLEDIQLLMNANSHSSDVAKINKLGHLGLKVNTDVAYLIAESLKYSQLTQGAFDITVRPLMDLWKASALSSQMPEQMDIDQVRNLVGYKNIEIKGDGNISMAKKGIKIDLGGIAKGYAVDEVVRILRENHIKDFLIDAGGDIYCSGLGPKRTKWKVGVFNPMVKNTFNGILSLSGMAVTTSGNYERFYEIGPKKYSHIINPLTGYPQETVISVTIIAPTAKEADMYSTALCVLGHNLGIKLLNSLDNVEGLIVEKRNGNIEHYFSKNYEYFLKN